MFGGLVFLTALLFYFGLSNRDTAGKHTSIDVQSAMLRDSYQSKSKPSTNAAVSAISPTAPSMNDSSLLTGSARSIPSGEKSDHEPMLSNFQNSENQLSETAILAGESFPVSEPMNQQDVPDEPNLDWAHEAASPPASDLQAPTHPPVSHPLSEPSDTEDLAQGSETLVAEVSVDSRHPPDGPNIARAQLTNGVINREPIDRIKEVVHFDGQALKRLFYYTEFLNMPGQKAVHRWEHDGNVVAEVKFNIRGARWRVYSSKYLSPSMAGEWKILVIDGEGKPLKSEHFVYSSYE